MTFDKQGIRGIWPEVCKVAEEDKVRSYGVFDGPGIMMAVSARLANKVSTII